MFEQRSSFETAQRYLDGISQHLRLTTTYVRESQLFFLSRIACMFFLTWSSRSLAGRPVDPHW